MVLRLNSNTVTFTAPTPPIKTWCWTTMSWKVLNLLSLQTLKSQNGAASKGFAPWIMPGRCLLTTPREQMRVLETYAKKRASDCRISGDHPIRNQQISNFRIQLVLPTPTNHQHHAPPLVLGIISRLNKGRVYSPSSGDKVTIEMKLMSLRWFQLWEFLFQIQV